MSLSRADSLRALERALLVCLRAPFEAPASPVFRAHLLEVIPLLDPTTRSEFAQALVEAMARFNHDAAALGWSLVWVYREMRQEGELP